VNWPLIDPHFLAKMELLWVEYFNSKNAVRCCDLHGKRAVSDDPFSFRFSSAIHTDCFARNNLAPVLNRKNGECGLDLTSSFPGPILADNRHSCRMERIDATWVFQVNHKGFLARRKGTEVWRTSDAAGR
jgi:hypothetical protein